MLTVCGGNLMWRVIGGVVGGGGGMGALAVNGCASLAVEEIMFTRYQVWVINWLAEDITYAHQT